MKSVFICGTGRCGTTIAKKALARHPRIFSFEHESFFLEHPYGVIDLFKNLTSGWNPLRSDEAFRNFEKFILVKQSKVLLALYRRLVKFQANKGLFGLISPPRYMSFDMRDHSCIVRQHLDTLKKDIDVITYKGCWPGMPALIVNPKMQISTITDEAFVAQSINKFLVNIFKNIMGDNYDLWLDDSIFIHLNALEVLKIIPDTKFIHMYRNPRDVISSYKQRLWAPSDPVQGAKKYKVIMDKWSEIKKKIPRQSYIEVCFEKLMSDHGAGFKQICDFMELDWDDQILQLSFDRANIDRWKNDLTQEDLRAIEPYIGNYMDALDYRNT